MLRHESICLRHRIRFPTIQGRLFAIQGGLFAIRGGLFATKRRLFTTQGRLRPTQSRSFHHTTAIICDTVALVYHTVAVICDTMASVLILNGRSMRAISVYVAAIICVLS
jgi:hypothetical protein